MKKEKRINKVFCILIILFFIVIINLSIIKIILNNQKYIYFNKPVSWQDAYVYIYNEENEARDNTKSFKLKQEKDYIYSIKLTDKILDKSKDISKYRIIFYSGDDERYEIKTNFEGYNKIFNIITGLGEKSFFTKGEWSDYDKNIKIGKIPTTKKKIKNIIYMIGDGMGENHILAGNIFKQANLNIQEIKNKCYVKTESLESITDSAAGATALATGIKTQNGIIGKDKDCNDVENIIEYSYSKGLKTGVICTQIINHATPASFVVHNIDRNNYNEIALSEINSCVNIMFGGGRSYFKKYEDKMKANNYKWINSIFELQSIDKNDKVIGTFAEDTISMEDNRIELADLTKEALVRLDNDKGFFLMIEGSDIDYYSHKCEMNNMLVEMIDFDDAVGIAKNYVDEHSDTLLIVTADHETGGIQLDNVDSKEKLNNDLFKIQGQHTNKKVLAYAYGKGAEELTKYDIIDNTSIYKFVRQALENNNE